VVVVCASGVQGQLLRNGTAVGLHAGSAKLTLQAGAGGASSKSATCPPDDPGRGLPWTLEGSRAHGTCHVPGHVSRSCPGRCGTVIDHRGCLM
jgi:hypothetical protein